MRAGPAQTPQEQNHASSHNQNLNHSLVSSARIIEKLKDQLQHFAQQKVDIVENEMMKQLILERIADVECQAARENKQVHQLIEERLIDVNENIRKLRDFIL